MAPRDPLDYYLGPTGIPDRIRALNEMNPIAGLFRGMAASGRVADRGLSPEERRAALGEAAMETGIAALPLALGRLAALFRVPATAASPQLADEAADVIEALTAYRPETPEAAAARPMTEEDIDLEFERLLGPQGELLEPDPGFLPPPPQVVFTDPTMDELAAGADNVAPFDDVLDEFEQIPFDMFDEPVFDLFDDPYFGIPGSRVLPDTAPAAQLIEVNPYLIGNDFPQRPQTWLDQGVAGIYSRSGRAAAQLRQPRYTDVESLRRELEARGAAPKELDRQLESLSEIMDDLGPLSAEDVQNFFSQGDLDLRINRTAQFADIGPFGGENYTSTVYHHPEGGANPPAAERHFSAARGPAGERLAPLFHTRAAQYDLQFPGGGRAHHVLELQSDFAQFRQQVPKTAEERAQMEQRVQYLQDLEDYRRSKGFGSLPQEEAAELQRTQAVLEQHPGLLDDFDQRYSAPYVTRENDWVDAGIRQNLVDAVNSGSDWVTFGNGTQANRHVGMPLDAAKSFYDTRVPRRVEDVLRRFSNQTGIEAPQLERIPFVDGEDVLGLRITPEFREALIQNGLPSFKNGGIVSLLHN